MREEAALFEGVCTVLLKVLSEEKVSRRDLSSESSLVEVGFDSLKFADLVGVLEDELGIVDFPMQAWIDVEAERTGPRYTVGSLVAECGVLLDATGKR